MIDSKGWNWDQVENEWWSEPADDVYPVVVRWAYEAPLRVLDLGCGIGRHSLLAGGMGLKVDAYDISQEGLSKLTEEAERRDLKIQTTQGDMLHLPYKDSQFDGVIAYNVVYHTDREGLVATLREVYRVLKPGGEFYVTLISKKHPSFSDSANEKIDENTLIKTHDEVEKGIPHHFLNEEDVAAVMEEFTIIKFRHVHDIRRGSWFYQVLAGKSKE